MLLINLLPGAEKRRRRQELVKLLSIAFSIFGLASIGMGVVIAIVFSQNIAIKSQIRKVETEIVDQEEKIAKYNVVIDESRILKSKLSMINDLMVNYNDWSSFFNTLTEVIPSQGVKFISLSVAEDHNMQVNGLADSPVKLAELLAVWKKADTRVQYDLQPADTLDRLLKKYNATEENLLALNQVEDSEALMNLRSIYVPAPFFTDVQVTSISPQSEEDVILETDRNVIFSLSIVLSENAF